MMRDNAMCSRRSFLGAGALGLTALVVGRELGAPGALTAQAGSLRLLDDEPGEPVKKVLRERFGDRPVKKGHVQLDIPVDAPDGRVVPVFLETDLPMEPDNYVKGFHLLVDHNPDIYLAGYRLTPALGAASIDTRIKMRRTSYVRAIAETSRGELWYAATKVYVGLNGCG
jgi:sulfur-oxidizing protein SoxY